MTWYEGEFSVLCCYRVRYNEVEGRKVSQNQPILWGPGVGKQQANACSQGLHCGVTHELWRLPDCRLALRKPLDFKGICRWGRPSTVTQLLLK